MTALRQRMIEDMQVRNYSPRTVEAYVAAVAKLAKHFGKSPDQLGGEELRAFQVHLLQAKVSWSQFNQIVCGLRFFYGTSLGRPEVVPMLPYGKKPKTLPVVLDVEEVVQLLATAKPGRERILLTTAYACGLRISELLHLQVTDIDSARMVVNVRQGKGAKDRHVPLSEQVLKYLARYTHRVAISNHRLVKLEEGRVTFRYRDYADSRKEKLLTLSAEEFLRRFVMHVLPKGFMKIRHYGLLASRQREARLRQSRRLLLAVTVLTAVVASPAPDAEPAPLAQCPRCGGKRLVRCPLEQPELILSPRPMEASVFATSPNTS